uniref:Uncharacterized protein n=1 Tax=Knipowitschia caucasica TaxID=637954 RepID=A0AAV2KBJ7_KNICA
MCVPAAGRPPTSITSAHATFHSSQTTADGKMAAVTTLSAPFVNKSPTGRCGTWQLICLRLTAARRGSGGRVASLIFRREVLILTPDLIPTTSTLVASIRGPIIKTQRRRKIRDNTEPNN